MHIERVDKLKPGHVLGRSLYNERRELVLAVGFRLDAEMIARLRARNYTYVYVWDGVAEELTTPQEIIGDTLRAASSKTVDEAIRDIRKNPALTKLDPEHVKEALAGDASLKNLLPYSDFEKMAGDIVEDILTQEVRLFSSLPVRAESSQEIDHAIDVTVLSVLVGQAFQFPKDELKSLAAASLLHDSGRWVLTAMKDRNKQELDPESLREHPTLSMLLVQGSRPTSFKEQITVHQHHEHLDGSGYPEELLGEDVPVSVTTPQRRHRIFRNAMILAAVNMYDGLVSGRFGELHTPDQALTKLVKEAGTKWNSHVVKSLVKLVQVYPVGTQVVIRRCSDERFAGCTGIVIHNGSEEPMKPSLILTHDRQGGPIQPRKVDLSKHDVVQLDLML